MRTPFVKRQHVHLKIFHKLLDSYGPRKWWPARTRFEVIVGAILTQNVSWSGAQKAVINLKKAGLLSAKSILAADHQTIAKYIKSSRFYNQKAKNLKAFCTFLMERHKGSLDKLFRERLPELRQQLLHIRGIGHETADCILLYAGGKPSFVSDAYTKRFLDRYGLLQGMRTYDEIRTHCMRNLPQDVYLYNEYHALLDHHGAFVCKAKPDCPHCPVKVIDKTTRCRYAA